MGAKMYSIFVTEQFRRDLDALDKAIRERVPKAIRLIEENPHHPGLHTHKQTSVTNRTIFRSRVNDGFRLLWEWLPKGEIGLWRVGAHDYVDAFTTLPGPDIAKWEALASDAVQAQSMSIEDWRGDLKSSQPFKHFPLNHLRLFGVPDGQLSAVATLSDPETIWDLPIPENVQYTLYDIVLKGTEWTADAFLDTKQLLYRTTVDQLEGYCEGKIRRLLLNLTDEQLALVSVSASGPILIKGVAGSGKTTIGLYRAHYLLERIEQRRLMFKEQASVLVLTYTSTLARALKQLYRELYGYLPKSVTLDTFDGWMMRTLAKTRRYELSIDRERKIDKRISLIKQAQEEVAQSRPDERIANASYKFLLDEIDGVLRARGIETLTDYQKLDRVGRSMGLEREKHRPTMWEVYTRYQELLDENNLVDFADLPRQLLKTRNSLPQHDVVIIDEAQDLPPSYLRLASSLIPDFEESRSLTLLADPAQSIYFRGISWKEGGINVRGSRTRTLAKNFRNTQQILEAARHILDGCGDLKLEDEFILPTSTHRLGPKPIVAQYTEPSEGLVYIVETIVRLCQSEKYRPGDIAILSRNDDLAFPALRKLLSKENLPWAHFKSPGFEILENQVKLLTMHSAKGLEFPVVFMIDLRDGVIPYIASPETEDSDLSQERKLFYVSMTRASERLYMLYPKQDRCRYLRDLAPETVTSIKLTPI
jgi:superfamily I DNA/RNA helicase/mRNA-degrading endonuclease RelE of RelBE toxin-antitoxin system